MFGTTSPEEVAMAIPILWEPIIKNSQRTVIPNIYKMEKNKVGKKDGPHQRWKTAASI